MRINRIGEACLKIAVYPRKGRKVDILIDPFNGNLRSKIDILLLSESREIAAGVKGKPFLIDDPGEYEVQGVFIRGIPAKNDGGNRLTIYTLEARKMSVCYLGHFGQKELSAEQVEIIGPIDVLIMPVGDRLSAKEIQKVVYQIEPKAVVLMAHKAKKLKAKLQDLLKEMGVKEIEEKNKISLKRTELKEEEMEIIVLSSQATNK